MNRFVSAALAGAVALSAVGLSATGASADRWHHHYGPSYGSYSHHGDAGSALAAGAILGLAVGTMMQPEPPYPYGYRTYAPPPPPDYAAYAPPPPPDYAAYAADAHFRWCATTYESYNGETDTWIDYRGVPHRCVGP